MRVGNPVLREGNAAHTVFRAVRNGVGGSVHGLLGGTKRGCRRYGQRFGRYEVRLVPPSPAQRVFRGIPPAPHGNLQFCEVGDTAFARPLMPGTPFQRAVAHAAHPQRAATRLARGPGAANTPRPERKTPAPPGSGSRACGDPRLARNTPNSRSPARPPARRTRPRRGKMAAPWRVRRRGAARGGVCVSGQVRVTGVVSEPRTRLGGIPSWELRVCRMGDTAFAPPPHAPSGAQTHRDAPEAHATRPRRPQRASPEGRGRRTPRPCLPPQPRI